MNKHCISNPTTVSLWVLEPQTHVMFFISLRHNLVTHQRTAGLPGVQMGHCSQTPNPGPETQHHGTPPPCAHQALCRKNSHRTSNCSSLPQETSPAKRGCCLGSTCRAMEHAHALPRVCIYHPGSLGWPHPATGLAGMQDV